MRYGCPNRGDATRRYQALALSSRLEAASPHQLVSILYEELAKALDVVLAVQARDGDVRGDRSADRARTILVALNAGLDLDHGGALAASLASVYRAMLLQLSRSIADGDRNALIALRSGVAVLAESWGEIAR